MHRLILAAPLFLAACAEPPPLTVVYQTYHGFTPQGERVTRDLDPRFFRTEAEADAYIAAQSKRIHPLDPTGRRSFDKEPIQVE